MYDQKERVKQDREWWIKLKCLAGEEDVGGFYEVYADYLEWANIISSHRVLLHKMARLVQRDVGKGNCY